MRRLRCVSVSVSLLLIGFLAGAAGQSPAPPVHPIVLRAARIVDIKNGRIVKPGEVLVQGERIVAAGTSVKRPAGAEVIDLGDRTLLPGLIDAHVHLFLHPGAEDLQTMQECRSERSWRCWRRVMT
jgi:imidazolonepropionase-like amidohydrolase